MALSDWLQGITIWWWKAPPAKPVPAHEHDYVQSGTISILADAVLALERRLEDLGQGLPELRGSVETWQSQQHTHEDIIADIQTLLVRVERAEEIYPKPWDSHVEDDLERSQEEWRTQAHVHRYDTMLGDGKGWRCGLCGSPKPKGA